MPSGITVNPTSCNISTVNANSTCYLTVTSTATTALGTYNLTLTNSGSVSIESSGLAVSVVVPAPEWAWMSGESSPDALGVYGTKGTAALNNIPGARDRSISWSDSSGNLWLFGGYGYTATSDGLLNDLWKYDIANNTWTWMSGESSPAALGVYGTKGTAALNNIPGARYHSISWSDSSGNLWLFGGTGYTATTSYGNLNDLWKYDIANNTWTWMSGESSPDALGVYGTKGTAALNNIPGAREHSISWSDSSGNLWLFGGYGYTATSIGRLNDLWKYNLQ